MQLLRITGNEVDRQLDGGRGFHLAAVFVSGEGCEPQASAT
jgi:hypothetical protein